MEKRRRAIALLSGGLDSALAAKVVAEQGVEVVGLHLVSPFGCTVDVEKVASHLGIRLIKKDKGEAYLDLVKSPQYGYGKQMNPCIDCRIYMFQIAEQVMKAESADFIVTGEVLGQRPMSQMRNSMQLIDSRASLGGRLLRPLSAQHLGPTVPELEGWVDRQKLFAISGRGRRDQLALAEKLGIKEYAAPGGGCLLTEAGFAPRLRDFFGSDETSGETRLARSQMLRFGRHFRWNESVKVIVGRDQKENEELKMLWQKAECDYFHPQTFLGPSAVAFGKLSEDDSLRVGQILVRYANVDSNRSQEVQWENRHQVRRVQITGGICQSDLQRWRL